MKLPQNSRPDILMNMAFRGEHPGVEIPVTPDEPDVLDANDVVEGVGGGGLATGLSGGSGWVAACGSRDSAVLAAGLQSVTH